jgi:spore coat polysaccharide biosynthesis protein SpsF
MQRTAMNKIRIIAVVQARMTSTRLPGKVLMPLAGSPAILRMMERVSKASLVDKALVATSSDPSDDVIVRTCEEHGIECARGPLNDVLARFVAAVPSDFDAVVRLTGDCPLTDPSLVDRHVLLYCREQPWAEYVSNAVVRTQPKGLDVEVVKREMLLRAAKEAVSPYDREHVLPWVQRRARIVPVTQEVDLSPLRLTVDTRADYAAISAIYETVYARNPEFTTRDVYRVLLERPEFIQVDPGVPANTLLRRELLSRIEAYLATEESTLIRPLR